MRQPRGHEGTRPASLDDGTRCGPPVARPPPPGGGVLARRRGANGGARPPTLAVAAARDAVSCRWKRASGCGGGATGAQVPLIRVLVESQGGEESPLHARAALNYCQAALSTQTPMGFRRWGEWGRAQKLI